jgi:hypothetical protein
MVLGQSGQSGQFLDIGARTRFPTNATFLFYELEQEGVVTKQRGVNPKTGKNYARTHRQDVADATMDLRKAGLVPWDRSPANFLGLEGLVQQGSARQRSGHRANKRPREARPDIKAVPLVYIFCPAGASSNRAKFSPAVRQVAIGSRYGACQC